ncbi:MAG: hypothetical protein Q7S86_01310 [bacterium]|nr:hypothetical protein [bacterium]
MNATKTGINHNWTEAMEDALDGEPIGTRATLRAQNQEWMTAGETIEWNFPSFGSLKIEVQGFRLGTVQKNHLSMRVPILLNNREPAVIPFLFTKTVVDSVRILHAQGNEVTDMTDVQLPTFRINVDWNEGRGHNMPQTRAKFQDNFDLIWLQPDGTFVQLEISVSTRKGKFWLVVQEVYGGQVVRTTQAKVEKLGVQSVKANGHVAFVAPLFPQNAFPGSDYLKNFGTMGAAKVVQYALDHKASVALSECSVAKWEPSVTVLPDAMKNNGWKTATVLWFNLVIGWGFALCEDGKPCFVHFSNILDETGRPVASKGEFPMLKPMTGVALKWSDGPDGKRKATAIRVL